MIGVFKTNIKVDTVDAYKTRDKPAHRIEKIHFKVPILRRTRVELKGVCVHMDSVMKKKSL